MTLINAGRGFGETLKACSLKVGHAPVLQFFLLCLQLSSRPYIATTGKHCKQHRNIVDWHLLSIIQTNYLSLANRARNVNAEIQILPSSLNYSPFHLWFVIYSTAAFLRSGTLHVWQLGFMSLDSHVTIVLMSNFLLTWPLSTTSSLIFFAVEISRGDFVTSNPRFIQ